MSKFIAALSFIFLSTSAFANTAPAPTVPEVTPPAPVVCANGPSWKEAGEKFLKDAGEQGAQFVGIKTEVDGSFTILIDVRGTPTYKGEPDFILAMIFDPNGCYQLSIMITEQVMQDSLGITLANE